jgi:hypothetical protein
LEQRSNAPSFPSSSLPTIIMNSKNENNEDLVVYLSFPWLIPGQKLSLSVWFYAVRELMREPRLPRWICPATLTSKLVDSYLQVGPPSSQLVSRLVSVSVGCGRSRGRRQYMEDRDFAFPSISIANDKVGIEIIGCKLMTSSMIYQNKYIIIKCIILDLYFMLFNIYNFVFY